MYEAYFGLRANPFQLAPDPSYYFASEQHRRAMAYLSYGVHKAEGFIVVTGEIGAGKTTLVHNLLRRLDPGALAVANLVTTHLDATDTLRMVAAGFGIVTRGEQKADLLLGIQTHLASIARSGKRCLLIVDEAQNLTLGAVEELRMLSNFQTDSKALLQTFLVGQPEFREHLARPEMRQLGQRVIASCHVGPLNLVETGHYIEHRLSHAGWQRRPYFLAGSYEAIHAATQGIPRRINALCDRLLLSAYLAERADISASQVAEVAAEYADEMLGSGALSDADAFSERPLTTTALLAALTRLEEGQKRLENELLRLAQSNRCPEAPQPPPERRDSGGAPPGEGATPQTQTHW